MLRNLKTISFAVALLAAATMALAGVQARVSGKVVDQSGKPIATAVLTITSPEVTDYKKVLQVKADGSYRVLILDATRKYLFHVEAPGFQAQEMPVKVPPGSGDNVFNFTLKTQQQLEQAAQQKVMEQPGFKQFAEAKKLLEQGDKAAARAKFKEAVAAKPDLVQAWGALANLAFGAGDYQEALQDAKKCLDLDDETVECLAVAANSCRALGDTKAEQKYIARYKELNPNDPATLFDEAAQYLNKMDDQHARPILEKCLTADPNYGPCIFQYGMLLLRSGDMAGAKKQLQHYLEVAPNGKQAATVKQTLKYL